LVTVLYLLEKHTQHKIFSYIPVVVMIYAFSMLFGTLGMFERNEEIEQTSTLLKTNLLPAMLFLMLLQVDIMRFFQLGKKLFIAFLLALFSLTIGFLTFPLLFGLEDKMVGAFGALCGSWMGGTANMIAVASALGVSDEVFGYILLVDTINYTWWFMLLLFVVPLAHLFNTFTKAQTDISSHESMACAVGCSCTIGVKRYWLFLILAFTVSFVVQFLSWHVSFISSTTLHVVLATFLGILGSFTRLKSYAGSSEVATSMLYLLIAIIGSRAVFESFDAVWLYVVVGFCILVLHAMIMVLGAKIFKLDLFSISVASLANIGGVASAPVLAAAYDKSLVAVGVLMAVMGYIIGTFMGLLVGNILIRLVG
jgi:uncharacterized membrane protein